MKRFIAEVWFWFAFLYETATKRRLRVLVRGRLRGARVVVRGLDSVPRSGSFVIAVNHYKNSTTLHVIASVFAGLADARPEVLDHAVIVAGRRVPPRISRIAGAVRRLVALVVERWDRHLIHIPLGDTALDLGALRAFRDRATKHPTLVFPEGKTNAEFGEVRVGAGRFLALMPVPTVPVGVFEDNGVWVVSFGPPMTWSRRRELSDVQLGMAIAALLPKAVAPEWQRLLGDWRSAHAAAQEMTTLSA
ncbi:MAG: hypothetical protein U0271_36860 [Polyangiaceae bacterium]